MLMIYLSGSQVSDRSPLGYLFFPSYILDIFVNCFLDILYLFVIMNNYLLHFYHILNNLKFCRTSLAVGHLGAMVTHQL